MLELMMLAAKVLFAAVGCGAGVQLARIARREGGLPLHAWASALVFAGGFGLLGFAAGPAFAETSRGFARALMLASDAVSRLVVLGLSVFVWRVFGGGRGLRSGLLAALLAAQGVNWIHAFWLQRWPEPTPPLLRFENQIVLALPFAWSAVEARLAHARSRKQLALGLTDAGTTNRLLIWSLASASFACIGLAAAAGAVTPAGSPFAAPLLGLQALLFAMTAGMVVLGFFPPQAYTRWLSDSAAR
jgi:hypothetical protein